MGSVVDIRVIGVSKKLATTRKPEKSIRFTRPDGTWTNWFFWSVFFGPPVIAFAIGFVIAYMMFGT